VYGLNRDTRVLWILAPVANN